MDPFLFNKMTHTATNYYTTQNKGQGFLLAPPPSCPRKRKNPQDCFLSFIDQIQDGLYTSSKLVRNEPRKTSDSYFVVRTFKDSVRSYRRNYSHKSVALFRTKKEGSTRKNIEYMLCSFVELDGSTDNSIKTQRDVMTLIRENNLPTVPHVIQTSPGHFHVIWNYNNPLPWNERNESYWTSQQKRLIKLFEQGGFLVDVGASMNPTQNLRNPSQLNPYNFKRRCEVVIHKSYQKTSLRAIYKALNKTSIPNPKRLPASVKLRRYLREHETFTLTLAELAENLNMSLRTVKTQVSRAVQNGDLRIVARLGNNNSKPRNTRYGSLLFIEKIPEVQSSISKINSLPAEGLLRGFKQNGTSVGRRNNALFALGLHIKAKLGKRASIEAIRAELGGGAMRSHVREKEFEKTLRNAMKSAYAHPFSLSKLRKWGLVERTGRSHKEDRKKI